MAKRQSKVRTTWDSNLAYVVGVIASDGNLSPDLRHLNITSLDYEMIQNCKNCLGISNKIGKKSRGGSKDKKYFVLQFGDKNFFDFLLSIGLTPKKSLTLGPLKIPQKYYFDFLRGCIDGDGNISVSKHPESKNIQLRIRLCSGSITFLEWVHLMNIKYGKITGGYFQKSKRSSVYLLSYGKCDSMTLLLRLYYDINVVCLNRKREIVEKYAGVA